MKRSYTKRPGLRSVDRGIRQVAPTFGKTAFVTHGAEARGTMAVESDAEQIVGHMLGLDPDIRQFEAQPLTVDLVDRKILRTHDARKEARARHRGRLGPIFYATDFAALTALRRQLVIEVKLDSHAGDGEYDVKLGLAREVLLSYGYELSKAVLLGNAMHSLHSNVVLLRQAAGRCVAVL